MPLLQTVISCHSHQQTNPVATAFNLSKAKEPQQHMCVFVCFCVWVLCTTPPSHARTLPPPPNPPRLQKRVRNEVTPSNRQHASKRKESRRVWKIGAPARPSHLPSRPAGTTAMPRFHRTAWVRPCRQLRDGPADRTLKRVGLRFVFVFDCVFSVFCCVCEKVAGGKRDGDWTEAWLD